MRRLEIIGDWLMTAIINDFSESPLVFPNFPPISTSFSSKCSNMASHSTFFRFHSHLSSTDNFPERNSIRIKWPPITLILFSLHRSFIPFIFPNKFIPLTCVFLPLQRYCHPRAQSCWKNTQWPTKRHVNISELMPSNLKRFPNC